MVMDDIISYQPSQMFESPSKEDPRAVLSIEDELNTQIKNTSDCTSSILQMTNKQFSDYEDLVTKLKTLLYNREEVLLENKKEISHLSKSQFHDIFNVLIVHCMFFLQNLKQLLSMPEEEVKEDIWRL